MGIFTLFNFAIILALYLPTAEASMRKPSINGKEALSYYKSGMTLREVATKMGVSKGGVRNAILREGFTPRPVGNKDIDSEIRRLYLEEIKSSVEVAKELGISPAGVTNSLKRMGILMRSASEASRIRHGRYDSDWESFREEYESGVPLEEVAKRANCCLATASKHLKRTGTKMRTRGAETNRPNSRSTIPFDVEKAIQMNKNGMTLTEIGMKLGGEEKPISVQVICRRFQKIGYKPITHRASKDKFKNYQVKKRKVAHAIGADRCTICPEKRGVQLCHIKARRFGGKLIPDNAVPLCPGHHWYFDRRMLRKKEWEKLRSALRVAAKKGYCHHHYSGNSWTEPNSG